MPRTRRRNYRRRSSRRFPRTIRRRYTRRGRRGGRRAKPLITGQQKHIRLRYLDISDLYIGPLTTGAISYYGFKLNSAFDVSDQTANTTMPGFNEWSAMYQSYRVDMAVMKCTFINTSQTDPVYVGMFARALDDGMIVNWGNWQETPGNQFAKKKLLGPASGGGDRCTISLVVPMGKIVGNKAQVKADVSYQALVTTDPIKIIKGYIWAGSYSGVTGSGLPRVVTNITITMYVKFFNKVTLVN